MFADSLQSASSSRLLQEGGRPTSDTSTMTGRHFPGAREST